MNINISMAVIAEIISIVGYVIISAVFGFGVIYSERNGEKTLCLIVGIVLIIVWRAFIKWIF
jgi:hypothetical protein